MEAYIIDGPQPDQDLSYPYIEKCEDLAYIQKGVKLKNFKDNMNKRNLELEFKLLRRLTENQTYTEHFRAYNPEITKFDRYQSIVPFNHTMVKLPKLTEDGPDAETYINANYIGSSKLTEPKAFIATQGPLENTIPAFWRMVWHNDISLIIMLCRCKEDKKNVSQSADYWANEVSVGTFKTIMTNETMEENGHLVKRTFKMEFTEEGATEPKIKFATQYQWIDWPDHSIPDDEDVRVIERLVDLIHQERTSTPNAPVLIHCSAGIGRSGTLIAIYNLEIIIRENMHDLDNVKLSVFGVVRRLREQRWGMVNTSDQYLFVYKFMADRVEAILKNSALKPSPFKAE